MKIQLTEMEWDTSNSNLPEKFVLDLSTIGLDDVTEENSCEIADHVSELHGSECLLSFQYTTIQR